MMWLIDSLIVGGAFDDRPGTGKLPPASACFRALCERIGDR
jgi:hypothetical protein